MCQSKLTEFFAELTEFAAELSEFSPPKKYSQNSIPPVSYYSTHTGNKDDEEASSLSFFLFTSFNGSGLDEEYCFVDVCL